MAFVDFGRKREEMLKFDSLVGMDAPGKKETLLGWVKNSHF